MSNAAELANFIRSDIIADYAYNNKLYILNVTDLVKQINADINDNYLRFNPDAILEEPVLPIDNYFISFIHIVIYEIIKLNSYNNNVSTHSTYTTVGSKDYLIDTINQYNKQSSDFLLKSIDNIHLYTVNSVSNYVTMKVPQNIINRISVVDYEFNSSVILLLLGVE